MTPPQHPAKEPDEHSDAESSSFPASPPVVCSQYQLSTADSLNVQGAQLLHAGHEAENAELLHQVNRPREIAHLYKNEAEMVLQIHEVQKKISGSKDYDAAVEALSTAQTCWLQPCPG